jgi:membrane-associated HD superfamily phosphohydrolase
MRFSTCSHTLIPANDSAQRHQFFQKSLPSDYIVTKHSNGLRHQLFENLCQQVDALARQREHAQQGHAQQLHAKQLALAQTVDNRLARVIDPHSQAKKKILKRYYEVGSYRRYTLLR